MFIIEIQGLEGMYHGELCETIAQALEAKGVTHGTISVSYVNPEL